MLWQEFKKEKIEKILNEKEFIIDIGGGLKAWKDKGNRFHDVKYPHIEKVKVLDPVDTFNPDIVGDVQNLPLADNSVDAFICHAVLEHVPNPLKAVEEMYRALKPGGYCYIYVPFLYYYHAEKGYYHDYWRFTIDILEHMFKDFKSSEIQSEMAAIGTLINLTPLPSVFPKQRNLIIKIGYFLDKLFGKLNSKQVSGYYAFLVK